MHNFNLVYITLFFVFALAFSAGPIGTFNIGRLEPRFEPIGRLFANTPAKLHFSIYNNSKSKAWSITLHVDSMDTDVGMIEPHSTTISSIDITPPKRGELSSQECYLQSRFPLSTVRFILAIDGGYSVLVYPEPRGEPLSSFLQKRSMHFGEERDFDGVASYSGAEPLSRIHWASVAKGEMAVKTFAHEHTTQELIFGFVDSGDNDEARLSQLCLWILECEKSSQEFLIEMPSRVLDSRREDIDEILRYLARY